MGSLLWVWMETVASVIFCNAIYVALEWKSGKDAIITIIDWSCGSAAALLLLSIR